MRRVVGLGRNSMCRGTVVYGKLTFALICEGSGRTGGKNTSKSAGTTRVHASSGEPAPSNTNRPRSPSPQHLLLRTSFSPLSSSQHVTILNLTRLSLFPALLHLLIIQCTKVLRTMAEHRAQGIMPSMMRLALVPRANPIVVASAIAPKKIGV
jgi:hypothetical protein